MPHCDRDIKSRKHLSRAGSTRQSSANTAAPELRAKSSNIFGRTVRRVSGNSYVLVHGRKLRRSAVRTNAQDRAPVLARINRVRQFGSDHLGPEGRNDS